MRYFLFIFLTICSYSISQTDPFQVGNWKIHSPYQDAQFLAKTSNGIYCASEYGLFFYDLASSEISTISKIEGLNDVRFTAMSYSEEKKVLIIGYENGNIDFLYDDEQILNINNIVQSSVLGSKRINNILIQGSEAFLSTGFGIVRLDIDAVEIQETYRNIGNDAAQVEILDAVVKGDTLYAVSSDLGIQKAPLDGSRNLIDFNSWITVPKSGSEPWDRVEDIEIWNDTIYVHRSNASFLQENGSSFSLMSVPRPTSTNPLFVFKATSEGLFMGYEDSLYLLKSAEDYENLGFNSEYRRINDVVSIDNGRERFLANGGLSLIRDRGQGNFTFVSPNGPYTFEAIRVYYLNKKIFLTGGSHTSNYNLGSNRARWFKYDNNEWTNYGVGISAGLPEFSLLNAISMTYNPGNNKYYIGTFTGGILEWDGGEGYNHYYEENSNLKSALSESDPSWVKVPGLVTDENNFTWAVNHETRGRDSSWHRIDSDGNWTTYTSSIDRNGAWCVDVQVDLNNVKWCLVGGAGSRSGLIAFDDNNGQPKERYLNETPNSGGLPTRKVNDFAIDKLNDIWVATDEGVGVFRETSEIFDMNRYNADLPIFEGRPLLQDEEVKAVAIDGGNRKWFGTTNGIFVFDDNAEESLFNFNEDNSPLLSNFITDIGINGETGEVFIITDKGIVSYWSDATENPFNVHKDDILIFPNPVTPEFTGVLSVRGVAADANVKFTDISGKLVYETDAEGGMATWNLRDLNGNRAETGIYLVYSTSLDGEDFFVGKFAIVK